MGLKTESTRWSKRAVNEVAGMTLAWAALAMGIVTAAAAVYIGIRSYTPVLFADEWQIPMDYMTVGKHYGLARLWAQHNEHRIPFQKLLQLADMFWWKTDHRPLLALGWIIQAAQCGAAAYLLKRTARLTRAEFLTALGLVIFCVLNPNQMQIFEWAFSPSFLGAFFCAMVSLGSLAMYNVVQRRFWLFLAIFCAFLAECNLASGVLVWVMLPVCGLLLRLRWQVVAALTASGALSIGAYLIGYHSPSNATSPLEGIRHPLEVAAFCQAYFAESWHFVAPRLGNFAASAALAAMLLLAVDCLFLRRRKQEPGEAWVLSLIWMMILTSFITALGRQISGVAQAREGRYQVAAMLFWCGIGLWLMIQFRRFGSFRPYALIVFQAVFLCVSIGEATGFPKLLDRYATDGYIRSLAGLAYEAGIYDGDIFRFIYPYPPAVPPAYHFLRARNWIDPPFREYAFVGDQLSRRFAIPAGEICSGYTDNLRLLNRTDERKELLAEGWAYINTRQTAVNRLLAVSGSGQIAGIGVSGGVRPDIPSVVTSIASRNTGWRIYAVVPPETKELSIYAILPGTDQVCSISNAKSVP